jgi:prepilin-type N-terminal cleavage/methylation domain-containing protein
MSRLRGFTLVEVLIAVTVSGVVVLLAHAVFTAVTDAGREIQAARLALDRDANGRRWMQGAFLSLDVGTDSAAGPFEGRPDHVAFGAWIETAGGWFLRQRVELRHERCEFEASMGSAAPIILADSVTAVAFDYLLEPGENTTWVREWISPVSAPLAVRIRIQRGQKNTEGGGVVDTLLFLIRERG